MSDYATDIAKYVPTVDQAAVDSIVKYCGIALRGRDSSLVAGTDPAELKRVVDGFAVKKLGLAPEAADEAVKKVVETMKAERAKSRVTFYYLLAEQTGTLSKLA